MILEILLYLCGCLGILAGICLAYIAPEELQPGERYFRALQSILLGVLFIFSVYLLVHAQAWILLAVFVALFIVLLVSQHFFPILLLSVYALFILPFSQALQLPYFIALLFLYGLPTGTLLWQKKILKQRLKKK